FNAGRHIQAIEIAGSAIGEGSPVTVVIDNADPRIVQEFFGRLDTERGVPSSTIERVIVANGEVLSNPSFPRRFPGRQVLALPASPIRPSSNLVNELPANQATSYDHGVPHGTPMVTLPDGIEVTCIAVDPAADG
ncbi:MAG: hypothetical protein ACRDQZ_17830, partial [Mycobacteriales bacterium]